MLWIEAEALRRCLRAPLIWGEVTPVWPELVQNLQMIDGLGVFGSASEEVGVRNLLRRMWLA